ncbi:protein STPG3 isoform X2 [Marmota marmota marmota]|uniref:protein STPG3 isoform X2 n=1 Tax=Marmota marmota marmota TaxID=9994 RepID=UPI0020923B5D|nr:protein STPG3 isoform X2 [Marmota marmota marmota]
MNFDQKAVKFLANFYINGGKHWTHGPLSQKPLCPTQPEATVVLRSGDEMWLPKRKGASAGLRLGTCTPKTCHPICSGTLKELPLAASTRAEVRVPFLPGSPQPAPGIPSLGMGASLPEAPTDDYSTTEGGGRRAWQTMWLQNESPFTQKADFNREQKWPSPADYGPLSRTSFPAFSFGGRRRSISKTLSGLARPGLLRGRGPRAHLPPQASVQAPAEKRPSPNTYDILPGYRLQNPRSPAFSMSRSPAFASWFSSSQTPGPAAYYVEDCYNSRFPSAPGVVIQGVRRPKRHDTGPFCTL